MQVVSTLCDICHDEGEETPAVQTVVIAVNKNAIETDLCQPHIEYVESRLEQYFQVGRRPGNVNITTSKGKVAPGGGEFACDHCTRAFATLQGLRMHQTRSHKILSQTKEAIRKREAKAAGGALPPGMTSDEADALLDKGVCIYDPDDHGPFPNRSGAGSHLRGTHGVSLSALGLSRPPGSRRHAGAT